MSDGHKATLSAFFDAHPLVEKLVWRSRMADVLSSTSFPNLGQLEGEGEQLVALARDDMAGSPNRPLKSIRIDMMNEALIKELVKGKSNFPFLQEIFFDNLDPVMESLSHLLAVGYAFPGLISLKLGTYEYIDMPLVSASYLCSTS